MTRPRRRFPFPTAGMLLATGAFLLGAYGAGRLGLALIALAGRALGVR